MKPYLILVFFFSKMVFAQGLTGEVLLEKAIAYHDPNSRWSQFNETFYVTLERADRSVRKSKITLDLARSFFELTVELKANQWSASLKEEACQLFFNGSAEITPEIREEYKLNCERAKMYRDYYSYLYGLPMKLKDPGTRIDPQVKRVSIEGTSYWVLKVTYDPSVGSDTWYFYFDTESYALKRYQFFHEESKNDGEYIILDDEIELSGIHMPKNRSWYYNSDDAFLGTDKLSK